MARVIRLAALLLTAAVVGAAQSTYPGVTLRYNGLFDMACTDATKQVIEPEAITELRSRMQAIRSLWAKEGAALLGAVPEVTGIPFRFS